MGSFSCEKPKPLLGPRLLNLVLLELQEDRAVSCNVMRLHHLPLGHDLMVDGVFSILLDFEEKPMLPFCHRGIRSKSTIDQRDEGKMPTRDLQGIQLILHVTLLSHRVHYMRGNICDLQQNLPPGIF
jgi:hypothetical protein